MSKQATAYVEGGESSDTSDAQCLVEGVAYIGIPVYRCWMVPEVRQDQISPGNQRYQLLLFAEMILVCTD